MDAINNNANAITNLNNNAVVQGGENINIDTVNSNQRGVSLARNLQHMESAQFGHDDGNTGTYINKETVLVANNDSYTNMSADAVRTFNGSENTGMTAKGIVIENTNTLEQASFTSGGMQASDDNATIRFTTTDVNAGNQQVHGIKAGTANTDAVNVSQLKEVENKITNISNIAMDGAKSYTDSEVAKVGAASAALSALHPLEFNKDDKWQFAVGFGNYKNKTATAIGAFYQPNENILLSLGTTLGTNNNMVNGGATFKFGKHSNKQIATDTKVQNLEQRLAEMEAKYNELLAKVESK